MPTSRNGASYALIALILLTGTVFAEDAETVEQAFSDGATTLDLRYRIESVSDDAKDKDALASTLRSVLAFRSGTYKKFQLFVEAENVAAIGDDNFNNVGAGDANNGVRDRPVVADADSTELNQAYLRGTFDKTTLTFGRQEINLGDQRHVGAVGWRQNHQSFDALTLANSSLSDWTISYSFVDRVHRIFGDSRGMTTHLLHANGKVGAAGKLTLYGYLLDYDDPGSSGLSTSTFGAELAGHRDLGGGGKLTYELEYAAQQDYGDNPNNIDAAYTHLSIGGGSPMITARGGLEILDGSPEDGQYRTPLATLHKFNGWADKFLATPTNGLEDLYLTLSGKLDSFSWAATFHDFTAATSDQGGAQYGSELDLLATFRFPCGALVGLKAALYDADELGTDTEKLMFWTAYKFQ
jgi:hypothetical protein